MTHFVCRDGELSIIKKLILASFFSLLVLFAGNYRAYATEIKVPDDYKTIERAVEKSLPGDTIVVAGGVYKENIIITKQLTIKSNDDPEKVIIQAKLSSRAVFIIDKAKNVKITNLTIKNSDVAGILIINSEKGTIQNNTITANTDGIVVKHSKDFKLKNNTINKNKRYGIYLHFSKNNIINKNTVNSNREKGVFLNSSDKNTLENNTVNLNKWNGIILWSSNYNTLTDNMVLRNGYGIVLTESDGNDLIGNTTFPNIYIILPVILIYIGIILYLVQKNLFQSLLSRNQNA